MKIKPSLFHALVSWGEKCASENKSKGGSISFFLSISFFISLVPNYREPGTGYIHVEVLNREKYWSVNQKEAIQASFHARRNRKKDPKRVSQVDPVFEIKLLLRR